MVALFLCMSFSLYVFVYPIFRISNKSYTKKRRVNVWNQKLKAMRRGIRTRQWKDVKTGVLQRKNEEALRY